MKCINCNEKIDFEDNFCPKCGELTAKGYSYYKNIYNREMINKGDVVKQNNRFFALTSLLSLGIIIFVLMIIIRGNNLFKPIAYMEKQITSYIYGFNTSLIKTDNKYSQKIINNYEEAISFIKKDFSNQYYRCNSNLELSKLETELESDYEIPSVMFCDISIEEAKKIKDVIEKIYSLFPSIKGSLTNFTITNATTKDEYIAKFQPMYQFVNINEDIKEFNKVNKTQILINSYYFLNENILSKEISKVIDKNWYVKDATWESLIAHELGHYLSFSLYLKENNLKNITLVTKDNVSKINEVLEEYQKGDLAKSVINEALDNYNIKYQTNLDIDSFALQISGYAGSKDKNNNLIYDEIIAEATHDYYLHLGKSNPCSLEILRVIKNRLVGV